MKNFSLDKIVRKNIQLLTAYTSARSEFSGEASVFLDANENNLAADYNRYPDPLQVKLKAAIGRLKGISGENIFIGNGSDEAIDLLIRLVCVPATDNIIVCSPTYGMYQVAAQLNDVQVKDVWLNEHFQLNVPGILAAIDACTKIIFICSPNNPTGNLIDVADIETLLFYFDGLVVVDEAYIDFTTQASWNKRILEYPNLVVLQTLSKAWGLAGLRVGMAYASTTIIQLLNKIKPPYNIAGVTQQLALDHLSGNNELASWIDIIITQKNHLITQLNAFPVIEKIYPSDANFVLAKVISANDLYHYLKTEGIIVRNRSSQPLCTGCLRITIGTAEENKRLLTAIKNYPQ